MKELVNPVIQKEILKQSEARFTWKANNTPEGLESFILEETDELKEAVELAMIGASAFEVASELGDVFYLFVRRVFASTDPVNQEVLEAMAYAVEVAELTGLDISQAVGMKIMRNDMKYLHGFSNNGYSYEKSATLSRRQWSLMGGDEQFSETYAELAEDL